MYKNLENGRSMIEMLGVLAIIAVLSVGGIAGYSKAMEKWKINKAIEGYSYLTQGLLEHTDDIRALKPATPTSTGKYYLIDVIQGLNLVPEGWTVQGHTLIDTTGTALNVMSRWNRIVYDMYIGASTYKDNDYVAESFSSKLCQEFMSNLVQPLHSSLRFAWIYRSKTDPVYYYGDTLCGDDNICLSNMTLSDIHKACTSCSVGNEDCLLTLEF